MEDILYPSKIELTPGQKPNEATLVVEPLFHGYGTNVGNTLRRVLLSSLPGAAITAVHIKGAQHEFATLPLVKEDVLEIVLNLKQVRLKSFAEGPVKLRLHVKGEKVVHASDIEPNADVEIGSPMAVIATLTDKNAEIDMELTVERGRGFEPTEERSKEKLDLGTIAVDALFSPVVSVGFRVENVRVGEVTNFDKLLMTIETDGTITPQDAVQESARLLINHFNLFTNVSVVGGASQAMTTPSEEAAPAGADEAPVEKPKRGKKKSEV